MTARYKLLAMLDSARQSATASAQVFLRDVGHGLLEVSHNTLALVGLAIVSVVVFIASQQQLRQGLEQRTLHWLQARHEARISGTAEAVAEMTEPDAITRATARDPKDLTRQQAAVATWLSRRYHVAPEPVAHLVQESWTVGAKAGLDPTLILAIMAIESSFNPFAQSPVGAQGLMQVLTRVHDDKYEPFGGNHAAFDPVTNLRVGVLVLKECISRAGSIEAGLRYYVGAANLTDDGGYAGKVLAEQEHLRQVVAGKSVSINAPLIPPAAVTVPATLTGPDVKPAAPGEKRSADQVALAG